MKKFIRPLLTVTTLTLATLALPTVAAEKNAGDAMQGMEMKDSSQQAQTVQATGTVKAINAQAGMITLAHGPIEALSWPAMTMPFKVADAKLLDNVQVGDTVRFTLQGPKHVVTILEKAEG